MLLLSFALAPFVVSEQVERAEGQVALARKSRCLTPMINGKPVILDPDVVIRDGVSGMPLAQGVPLCDSSGNTAVTDASGRPSDFAVLPR